MVIFRAGVIFFSFILNITFSNYFDFPWIVFLSYVFESLALFFNFYFLTIVFSVKVSLEILVLASYFIVLLFQFSDLGSFLSGIIIKVLRIYKKGDFVFVANNEFVTTVEKVGFIYTILKENGGRYIKIKNYNIFTNSIINISKDDTYKYVHVQYSMILKVNISSVTDLIKSVIEIMPKILQKPKKSIHTSHYADGYTIIDIYVWCLCDDYYDVEKYLKKNVKYVLLLNQVGLEY